MAVHRPARFRSHARVMGLEGIVAKRRDSRPVKHSGVKSLQQNGQRRMSIASAVEETFICSLCPASGTVDMCFSFAGAAHPREKITRSQYSRQGKAT
jgi:hypothetical protein